MPWETFLVIPPSTTFPPTWWPQYILWSRQTGHKRSVYQSNLPHREHTDCGSHENIWEQAERCRNAGIRASARVAPKDQNKSQNQRKTRGKSKEKNQTDGGSAFSQVWWPSLSLSHLWMNPNVTASCLAATPKQAKLHSHVSDKERERFIRSEFTRIPSQF